jgi:hypothetical protein
MQRVTLHYRAGVESGFGEPGNVRIRANEGVARVAGYVKHKLILLRLKEAGKSELSLPSYRPRLKMLGALVKAFAKEKMCVYITA